jgi:hypothetical protein
VDSVLSVKGMRIELLLRSSLFETMELLQTLLAGAFGSYRINSLPFASKETWTEKAKEFTTR